MKKNKKYYNYIAPASINKAYWNERILIDKSKEYGFDAEIIGNTMFVRTRIGRWYFRLNYDGGIIKLYHHNLLRKSSRNNFNCEYHLQRVRFHNPIAVLEYIFCHDRNGFEYMRTSKEEKMMKKVSA